MKLGVAVGDTWDFFYEIYDELCAHHETTLFNRRSIRSPFFYERINRYVFKRDLDSLLSQNDVVFFEWANELLVAASHLPKTCGIVTRLHRYEMYQWVDQVNWENVDKIILVSEAKRDEFVQRFPAYEEKAVAIMGAISLEKFSFRPGPYQRNIGILCHISPRKRVYELILDFYELTKINPDFHLHIGGGPHPGHDDYFAAVQELVRDLKLEKRVTFYGPVTNTQDWLHSIDIFVSNSYSEGLQVALMEAMASGCYCLSHHWAGAEEQLPPENLFYSGNELQHKILAFDECPEVEKHTMRSRMRELAVEHNDVNRSKQQIRELVEQVGASANRK
jgi:glycosyltransferase involved in cell wall biosynthesis